MPNSDIRDLYDDFDRKLIAAGVFKERIYDVPKISPKERYTPAQHCEKFGHTWYSAGEIEDHYGEAKEFSKCAVCGETYTSYSFD